MKVTIKVFLKKISTLFPLFLFWNNKGLNLMIVSKREMVYTCVIRLVEL